MEHMPSITIWLVALKAVLLILTGVLCRRVFLALTSPLEYIPGPWYARLTNLPLKWAVIGGRRMYLIHPLHEKYGDTVLFAPNKISVADI